MKTNRLPSRSLKTLLLVTAWSFLFTQVNPVHAQVESTTSASASSTTAKRPLPDRVQRFCREVENFPSSSDGPQMQAKQFATNLCAAINTNKRLSRVTTNTLSPEAAKKLADYFRDDIVAALAYKEVIASAEILKPLMQGVRGEQAWRRMPLITKHSFIQKPLTDVPEVVVTVSERDQLTNALADSTAKAKTIAELRQAYKGAYHGHRGWFKTIAPYFEEEEDDETEE
ncbi:MAG TPA: hypothetical protein PK156_41715 [Polyangium sp.]|nr:hypothetical protein [Polyangium sp.]